jgi:hypothetical protein
MSARSRNGTGPGDQAAGASGFFYFPGEGDRATVLEALRPNGAHTLARASGGTERLWD